jgi:hypothetical protein
MNERGHGGHEEHVTVHVQGLEHILNLLGAAVVNRLESLERKVDLMGVAQDNLAAAVAGIVSDVQQVIVILQTGGTGSDAADQAAADALNQAAASLAPFLTPVPPPPPPNPILAASRARANALRR